MNYLPAALIFCTILIIDYHMWLRGGKAFFFGDQTEIEKDLREIQKLETKAKLKKLQKDLRETNK